MHLCHRCCVLIVLVVRWTEAIDDARFDEMITDTVSAASEESRLYKYEVNNSDVVRIWIRSFNATVDSPLLTVVRERRAILSWQVPLILKAEEYSYNTVSRTICPYSSKDTEGGGQVWVGLTTANQANLTFQLVAKKLRKETFDLNLDESQTFNATPSQPYYVRYRMSEDTNSVLLQLQAWDTKCLIMSVQPIECPVLDLDNNVNFVGTYQTITTKGAIPVYRSYLPEFYVVFVVRADDEVCTEEKTPGSRESQLDDNRRKIFQVVIKKTMESAGYALAIGVTVGIFLVVYGIALIVTRYMSRSDGKKWEGFLQQMATSVSSVAENEDISDDGRLMGHEERHASYGALDEAVSSNLAGSGRGSLPESGSANPSVNTHFSPPPDSELDAQYDTLDDVEAEKHVIRSKVYLTVPDLARKPWKQREKKYKMYYWNLITISVFYVLPVAQLVLAYQNSVMTTGNEDICYYNFLCSRPLAGLFAFNSVFSNVGFVFLGFLFLFLVRWRDYQNQRRMKENYDLATKYGVPKHFGLFYTMAISLIMEGVLSGCYHVCPNYSNFQFDTAFMYMISALGILKIYQMRHPDINAHSHVAYIVMAIVIMLSVVGTVWNTTAFWIIFTVCYILLILALSAEFYYKGQWHLDKGFYQRMRQEWPASNPRKWLSSTYPDRAVFILIFNFLNFAFVILGLVTTPKDFGSHLLSIFILNLLLYMCYYVTMKIRSGEKLGMRPWAIIILSFASWIAAMYFYFSSDTDWTLTPAKSRAKNDYCMLLDFYDSHDVWHFLASVSLFLSFTILLTIDDNLDFTHQSKIVVF